MSDPTEYTPTTEEVRGEYVGLDTLDRGYLAEAEFDRWLVEHDRQVSEKAWDEGWREHYLELAHQRADRFHPITKANPYRKAGETDEQV